MFRIVQSGFNPWYAGLNFTWSLKMYLVVHRMDSATPALLMVNMVLIGLGNDGEGTQSYRFRYVWSSLLSSAQNSTYTVGGSLLRSRFSLLGKATLSFLRPEIVEKLLTLPKLRKTSSGFHSPLLTTFECGLGILRSYTHERDFFNFFAELKLFSLYCNSTQGNISEFCQWDITIIDRTKTSFSLLYPKKTLAK